MVKFSPEKILLLFWILSKLPPPHPQFGQLVHFLSDAEIQNLKDSLGLKILYLLYIIQQKKQFTVQIGEVFK